MVPVLGLRYPARLLIRGVLLPLCSRYDASPRTWVVTDAAISGPRINNHRFWPWHLKILMNDMDDLREKMPIVNRYVQALCGLYSRVARQLKVDRSYVSRVARGERHSDEVERALTTEFDRIMGDGEGKAA